MLHRLPKPTSLRRCDAFLPIHESPVDNVLFYSPKAPRFLPRTTMPPSRKTNLNGHRPPRYCLAWPLESEEIFAPRGPDYTTIVSNAVKALIKEYGLGFENLPSPVPPRSDHIQYRHGDEGYLFFVWITDNVDEKGLSCAKNIEYLEKIKKLLPGIANEDPIWIRVSWS
ncbi:hypothetical protein CYLTODRAFT_457889 [Cylindrobasidium torrendii FP15055 ss-10]|uniref:Uncharacterized protein n=1 Tax=Cylindrobasidium torrendii FP15055 ss-10 TaxID=1314674 RepID=A0A0D7B0J3_9AGAR|nr:hypothetical protein CYLTODRAFT_457889 [Cylindrobasidium torrendii FP15055 ss-10]